MTAAFLHLGWQLEEVHVPLLLSFLIEGLGMGKGQGGVKHVLHGVSKQSEAVDITP